MEEFYIEYLCDSMGQLFFGGECRCVEIVCVLVVNLKFILFDELFVGVDLILVIDIKCIIEYLCDSGLGVLIIDYNVCEILVVCECVYIVSQGYLIVYGMFIEIL